MKTIAYYISNSGFGHLTRSLAIIKSILKQSEYDVYISCGKEQLEYARVYLIHYIDRIHFNLATTEADLVYKNESLVLDSDKTLKNVELYVAKLDKLLDHELKKIQNKHMKFDLVITDISILGILVAIKLQLKVIGISNYTWYHRFKKMNFPREILDIYLDAYNKLDCLFRLPLSDDMSNLDCEFKNAGYVMRPINKHIKMDLEKMYWPSCYLSIGQLANKDKIIINFQSGYVFTTGKIKARGDAHVVNLPKRISHSQDYMAASSLALVKPGWSTVAECLIIGLPFGVIVSDSPEDNELVAKLKEMNCCFSLHEDALEYIDIKKLNIRSVKHKPIQVEDSTSQVAKDILDCI